MFIYLVCISIVMNYNNNVSLKNSTAELYLLDNNNLDNESYEQILALLSAWENALAHEQSRVNREIEEANEGSDVVLSSYTIDTIPELIQNFATIIESSRTYEDLLSTLRSLPEGNTPRMKERFISAVEQVKSDFDNGNQFSSWSDDSSSDQYIDLPSTSYQDLSPNPYIDPSLN